MKESLRRWYGIGMTGVALSAAASCSKPAERASSELREAGYALTQDGWFQASAADDVEALKHFTAANFPVDVRDASGDTALHVAAGVGAENAADYLLRRGIPIDVTGSSNQTPLMRAVRDNRPEMVKWLLAQGADPRIADANGFRPLMLAVSNGSTGSISELAPYLREDLDSALLLAAMMGNAPAIDELTNYGGSVYATMEDGRTALMMAAENGHAEAVELLLDIGASRFATDAAGHSAADYARDAGHEAVATAILRVPLPEELAFETAEEIGAEMAAIAEDASAGLPTRNQSGARESAENTAGDPVHGPAPRASERPALPLLDGHTLGASSPDSARRRPRKTSPEEVGRSGGPPVPLVMRHYRAREMPIEVEGASANGAFLRIRGSLKPIEVRPQEPIPGTRLVVTDIRRKWETSKMHPTAPLEVTIVDVLDPESGISREWRSGLPTSAHDPVALVEDPASGERYIASPGHQFFATDGEKFTIRDVRPGQLVVEDSAGAVHTLPLRGPRG
jgi:hypothetical protein